MKKYGGLLVLACALGCGKGEPPKSAVIPSPVAKGTLTFQTAGKANFAVLSIADQTRPQKSITVAAPPDTPPGVISRAVGFTAMIGKTDRLTTLAGMAKIVTAGGGSIVIGAWKYEGGAYADFVARMQNQIDGAPRGLAGNFGGFETILLDTKAAAPTGESYRFQALRSDGTSFGGTLTCTAGSARPEPFYTLRSILETATFP